MKTKQKKLQEAIKEFKKIYGKKPTKAQRQKATQEAKKEYKKIYITTKFKTKKEPKPTKEQLKEYPDCKGIISQHDGIIYQYISNDGCIYHIQPKTNLLDKYCK